MLQEDSGLFHVSFTEKGKDYLRKFARISFLILVLSILVGAASIYIAAKSLVKMTNSGHFSNLDLYYQALPFFLMVISLFNVISTIYYSRFPHLLLTSIEKNDEPAANKAFGTLYKAAFLFLINGFLNTTLMIWSIAVGEF